MPNETENGAVVKLKVRNDIYNVFAEFLNSTAYRNDIKILIISLLIKHALTHPKIMKNITSIKIPKTKVSPVKYVELFAHINDTTIEGLYADFKKAGIDCSVPKDNILNAGLEMSNQFFLYYNSNGGKRIVQRYVRDNEFQKDIASFFKSAKVIKRIITTYKKDEEFLDNIKEIFGEDINWLYNFENIELDNK